MFLHKRAAERHGPAHSKGARKTRIPLVREPNKRPAPGRTRTHRRLLFLGDQDSGIDGPVDSAADRQKCFRLPLTQSVECLERPQIGHFQCARKLLRCQTPCHTDNSGGHDSGFRNFVRELMYA